MTFEDRETILVHLDPVQSIPALYWWTSTTPVDFLMIVQPTLSKDEPIWLQLEWPYAY